MSLDTLQGERKWGMVPRRAKAKPEEAHDQKVYTHAHTHTHIQACMHMGHMNTMSSVWTQGKKEELEHIDTRTRISACHSEHEAGAHVGCSDTEKK